MSTFSKKIRTVSSLRGCPRTTAKIDSHSSQPTSGGPTAQLPTTFNPTKTSLGRFTLLCCQPISPSRVPLRVWPPLPRFKPPCLTLLHKPGRRQARQLQPLLPVLPLLQRPALPHQPLPPSLTVQLQQLRHLLFNPALALRSNLLCAPRVSAVQKPSKLQPLPRCPMVPLSRQQLRPRPTEDVSEAVATTPTRMVSPFRRMLSSSSQFSASLPWSPPWPGPTLSWLLFEGDVSVNMAMAVIEVLHP